MKLDTNLHNLVAQAISAYDNQKEFGRLTQVGIEHLMKTRKMSKIVAAMQFTSLVEIFLVLE